MPFLYELMLEANEPEYTVVQHLVPPGTLVGTGQAVAVLSDGSKRFHLQAPRQGLLVEWFAEDGATVGAMQPIARVVCEGSEEAVPFAMPQRLEERC